MGIYLAILIVFKHYKISQNDAGKRVFWRWKFQKSSTSEGGTSPQKCDGISASRWSCTKHQNRQEPPHRLSLYFKTGIVNLCHRCGIVHFTINILSHKGKTDLDKLPNEGSKHLIWSSKWVKNIHWPWI